LKPEIFEKLAASGRYVNTGKVLIGLQYQRPPRPMGYDEIRIQNALLGVRGPRLAFDVTVYLLYAISVITLAAAVVEALK
jgi:hypothetical protein